MPRPFGVKVGKKRKISVERRDEDEIENDLKKASPDVEPTEEDNNVVDDVMNNSLDTPIIDSDHSTGTSQAIFVIERASLEVAKVGKSYQILNSDDHANFLMKHKKNPAEYRPDILHQALLSILDSSLNKAGKVKAVYVRTDKGVLFEVKPNVLMPRTYKRFAGLMLQLLQKLSISAAGKREKLIRVIKKPVTQYLPVGSRKIGFSVSSKKIVDIHKYVATDRDDPNYVFVVGAMTHGKVDCEYVEDYLAISSYPLSAACCLNRICGGLEQKWNVL